MRRIAIVVAICLGALAVAWLLRFGTDDAYISFVYARSLVTGHGLAWFGTHIEGYTNFLWTLWSALGLELGRDPLHWAWGASLAAMIATLVITYRLASTRTTSGIAAILVLATNFTFLAFGTSGLETMLQTALLAAVWFEIERMRRTQPGFEQVIVIGVYASLALWTRLDSAPMLAVLAVVAGHRLAVARASIRMWVAGVMPVLVLVGGWFLWKLSFYGSVLPNTFYVKAGTGSAAHGAWFVWQFLQAYVMWPLLAGIVVLAVAKRKVVSALPLAIVTAQLAYIVAVGGDFMEFRFFVPLMPALAVALAEFATTPMQLRVELRIAALIAFVGAFSLKHGATFDGAPANAYDSVHGMAHFYGKVRDNDWSQLGKSLHDLTGTGASIACNGAGAIPYFADLPTVDQLGLNDEYIAKHGARPPENYSRPGHQRFATYDYLVTRQVTFVLGSPTLITRGGLRKDRATVTDWFETVVGLTKPPAGTYLVVGAPVGDTDELLMLYLTPDDEVTAKIAGWDHLTLHAH
jgi:arabinofuranosyltransferase